jgi:hypothetical protein
MKTLLFALLLITASCSVQRPTDIVIVGRSTMVIYNKEEILDQYGRSYAGKYLYWINDGTPEGWGFTSYEEYEKGDTIVFIKKAKTTGALPFN